MVDYYLIRKGALDVPALYQEDGRVPVLQRLARERLHRLRRGHALLQHPAELHHMLPSWWGVYGWFFGVAIAGATYYALVKARGVSPAATPMSLRT